MYDVCAADSSIARDMPALSGLQAHALALYRKVQRESRKLDADTRKQIREYARDEFERYRAIEGRQFQLIEHLIRKGHKQLAYMKHADFTDFVYKKQAPAQPVHAT